MGMKAVKWVVAKFQGDNLNCFTLQEIGSRKAHQISEEPWMAGCPWDLSAPSHGDALRSKSAIRLRGQTICSDFLRVSLQDHLHWKIANGAHNLVQILGGDFFAVMIRLRLRCVLWWKWLNLLLAAEIPCNFDCDSSDRGCDAVVHLLIAWDTREWKCQASRPG